MHDISNFTLPSWWWKDDKHISYFHMQNTKITSLDPTTIIIFNTGAAPLIWVLPCHAWCIFSIYKPSHSWKTFFCLGQKTIHDYGKCFTLTAESYLTYWLSWSKQLQRPHYIIFSDELNAFSSYSSLPELNSLGEAENIQAISKTVKIQQDAKAHTLKYWV